MGARGPHRGWRPPIGAVRSPTTRVGISEAGVGAGLASIRRGWGGIAAYGPRLLHNCATSGSAEVQPHAVQPNSAPDNVEPQAVQRLRPAGAAAGRPAGPTGVPAGAGRSGRRQTARTPPSESSNARCVPAEGVRHGRTGGGDRAARLHPLEDRPERAQEALHGLVDLPQRRVQLSGLPEPEDPAEELGALLDEALDVVALDLAHRGALPSIE